MAHPNINERQAHVKRLLEQGTKFDARTKKDLAAQYECSVSAIHADIVAFSRPETTDTPFQSHAMRKKIFARDGRICQYCGDDDAYEYIVEHVIPAAIGGVARPHNLVIACQKCNTTKRRQVWIPKNFDAIVADHPNWRDKVAELAIRDFAVTKQEAEQDAPSNGGQRLSLNSGFSPRRG